MTDFNRLQFNSQESLPKTGYSQRPGAHADSIHPDLPPELLDESFPGSSLSLSGAKPDNRSSYRKKDNCSLFTRFLQKVGSMLGRTRSNAPFHGHQARPSMTYKLYSSPYPFYYAQPMKGTDGPATSELHGSSKPMEMPTQFHQRFMPEGMRGQRASAMARDYIERQPQSIPPSFPSNSAAMERSAGLSQHMPGQVYGQESNLIPSALNVSPLGRQSGFHARPLMDTISSHHDTTNTPASATTSPTISPITQSDFDNSLSTALHKDIINNMGADYYGASSNSFSSYPPSPEQSGAEAFASVSPASTPLNSCEQSYDDPLASLPTPVTSPPGPATNYSPRAFQPYSFEGSPSSYQSHTSGYPDSPSSVVVAVASPDAIIPNTSSRNMEEQSAWSRFPRIERSYNPNVITASTQYVNNDSLDEVNKFPPPPYAPSTPPIASYPGDHIAGIESRTNPPNDKGGRLSLEKHIPKLLCDYCDAVFNGQYQRGNQKRHTKRFHSGTDPNIATHKCRICHAAYKRADARRKHEWKKHRLPDCRPEKRGAGEKRIYMPGAQTEYHELATGYS